MELSEQELVRREKLDEFRKLGIDPYPAELYEVNVNAKEIKEFFPHDNSQYQDVSIAGRIMSVRDMGKASFVNLQDSTGRIQLYVKRDDLCTGEDKTLYDTIFKKLLDIGDIIGVTGFVFITKMGETSIHVKTLKVLCKSIRPLPIVKLDADGKAHDEVTDAEFRYRQRYADLVINEDVRDRFRKRTQVIQSLRETFNSNGYLEVETPILQPIPGGAAARPFITHHNTLDTELYLRIANELYLKRLIVGGYEGVYEFAKDFRNEGMDRTHNPEFTMVEIYVAYKDYNWMMDYTEMMIEKVAMDLHGKTKLPVGDKEIDFARPFKRITMFDSIKEFTGIDISQMDEAGLRKVCADLGIHTEASMGKGKLIDEIFGAKCEPHYIQPTFITDYPVEMSPLCKKHRSKEGLVERFELMVNGKELCNAYSELNDPLVQRARLEEQAKLMERGDNEAMYVDNDFIRALEYGMPPASGMGMGIDRLVMIMTNSPSIQDVLFFPQMRAEAVIEKPKEEKAETTSPKDPAEVTKILEILSKNKSTTDELLPELTTMGLSKTKLAKLLDQLTQENRIKREGKFFFV